MFTLNVSRHCRSTIYHCCRNRCIAMYSLHVVRYVGVSRLPWSICLGATGQPAVALPIFSELHRGRLYFHEWACLSRTFRQCLFAQLITGKFCYSTLEGEVAEGADVPQLNHSIIPLFESGLLSIKFRLYITAASCYGGCGSEIKGECPMVRPRVMDANLGVWKHFSFKYENDMNKFSPQRFPRSHRVDKSLT